LNYFFGGADPHLSGPASVGAHPGRIVGQSGSVGAGGGVGGQGGRENPLHGRKGLEGNAAAFEMKSLEKHLEPVKFSCPRHESLYTDEDWIAYRHLLSTTLEKTLD